jgi:diguanylate cyclase (GGDEF)-like protein
VACIDQWVTPAITPYLICCMISGVAIYLRPVPSACVYLLSFAAFYYGIGLTQENAAQLLSNRLNGGAAAVLGWVLSVVIWRKFATITLQQEQLAKANSELQEKQRELERLTRLDGLTGLFNRNTFVELSRRELERAQRQGSSTAILILDLDHFKRINDTWGHPAGDAVLRHVASVAVGAVRSTDLVGRLGGEEFIVLLPCTSTEAARKLAEKLRAKLQASPVMWQADSLQVTASIGLAATTAIEKRDFEALYNAADKALYLAKTRGRNRVES